jgi:hypothetical protein
MCSVAAMVRVRVRIRSGSLPAGPARRRRATAPGGSTETAVSPPRGEPDESPANRRHRKSPVSRAFSVAGL